MGVSASCNLISLSTNPHLLKLASAESIPLHDTFWETLLEFTLQPANNSADSRLLEESVGSICASFGKNNLQSGNMSSLLSILMSLIKYVLSEDKHKILLNTEELDTLYNTLLIVRTLSKHLVQSESMEVSINHFKTPDIVPMSENSTQYDSPPTIALKHVSRYETCVDELCYYLFECLINLPVRSETLQIHGECMKILTILCSAQLYHNATSHNSPYFTQLMTGRCSQGAPKLVFTMLHNLVQQAPPPAVGMLDYMWSYVPFTADTAQTHDKSKEFVSDCLLFTLLIVNHWTQKSNPYREALFTFGHTEPGSNINGTCFNMNLNKLYDYFCKEQPSEQNTLLLYTLLHGNENVKCFILSRTDIEAMLLPMLRVIYDVDLHSTHHLYMIHIILLMLTHDDSFSSYIHNLVVPVVPWYKERLLTDVTLGGILILVILRTIQTNITKTRDRYLHTNCLATLANMSSKFHSFHPYVAEKILSLFTIIVKKYTKIRNTILGLGGETIPIEHSPEYMESEQDTLEDIIRMFLEMFNNSICYSGKTNPVFLYELLHKRDIFSPFQTHPSFSQLVINIESILGYLTTRLEEKSQETGSSISVGGVMTVIEEAIRQWPADRLQKSPVLKFEYVEESQPEEFFLPYIWTLEFSNSSLFWDTSRITLSSTASSEE